MLLRLLAYGTIVDERATGYGTRAVVDRDRRIDEDAIGIAVADTHFRDLAGAAGHRVLMAFSAGRRIKDRPESVGGRIFNGFENLLIESETVAGRLRYAVARTLGTGVLDNHWGIEADGCFGRALLSNEPDGN